MRTFYLVPGIAWGLCFTVRHLVQGGRLLLSSGTPTWQPLGRWVALGIRQGFPIFFSLKSPRCGLRPWALHDTQEKPLRPLDLHKIPGSSHARRLQTFSVPSTVSLAGWCSTKTWGRDGSLPPLPCHPGTPSLRWRSTWLLSTLI